MFIIISRVLRCFGGALNLLSAQAHEPDLRIVHYFLLLKLRQSLLEVLQCVCNRAEEVEEKWVTTTVLRHPQKIQNWISVGTNASSSLFAFLIPFYFILNHNNIPVGAMGSLIPSKALSFSTLLLKILLLRAIDTLSTAVPKRMGNCWVGFGLSSCPVITHGNS